MFDKRISIRMQIKDGKNEIGKNKKNRFRHSQKRFLK